MKRSGAIGNEVAVTRRHIGEYDANRRLDIRGIRKITKDLILVNNEVSTKIWGCSSAGRAPALQAGGQEFDPPHLHQRASEDEETTTVAKKLTWACSSGG